MRAPFQQVARLAREAGPWTKADEVRADVLRRAPNRTAAERFELDVLRRREVEESLRIRKGGAR